MRKFKCLIFISFFISLPVWIQAQQTNYFLHTITKGQSLYSIAVMYNVTTDEIIRLNPGSEKVIKAGSTLKIPQKNQPDGIQYHTIQAGETLYKLMQTYHVTVQSLCDANPGLSEKNFRAGQVIVIPRTGNDSPMVSTIDTATQEANAPQSTLQGIEQQYQTIHKVKRRETIYSICKEYGITEEELITANPELKEQKLKRGYFLQIPYHQERAQQTETAENQKPLSNSELFDSVHPKTEQMKRLKVAILLSFMLNGGNQGEQARMVEYYQGFLMAINELKKEGISFDIYTYDTQGDPSIIQKILSKKEMQEMDLIIGPSHANHIKSVSDFSEKNKIRLVVPFTSKCDEVFNNPYLYQVNTPQSYLYSEVYEHFLRKFRNSNIIFVDAMDGATDKQDFIRGFKQQLYDNHINFKEIKAVSKESIEEALSPTSENMLIPTSGSNIALIKILPYLKALKMSWETQKRPDKYSMHLFGYPEWQTYTTDYLDDFYTFDTYFYTSFYANNLAKDVVDFQQTFRKWYHKEIMNTYPKYAILGYETSLYLLKGMSLYGDNMEANLNRIRIKPIQTSFKFERASNWGGFINKKVFFIHFTKDHELIKMDFDQ